MGGSRMTRGRLAITIAAVMAAIAGGGWTAAMAASSPHPSARGAKVTTSDFSVLIGPFIAKGGYEAEIEAVGCGTDRGGVLVTYERGNARVALVHNYEGRYTSCTVSKNLETATLKVKWGTVLDLNLKLAGTAKLQHEAVEGCTGSRFEYRGVGVTGTTILSIHRADFGRLVKAKPTVHLSAVVGSGCSSSSGSGTGGLPVSGGGSTGFAITHGHSALARAWSVGQAHALRAFARSAARPTGESPAFTTTTPTATTTTTVTTPPTTTTVTGPSTTVTTTPTVPEVTPDGSGTIFTGIFNRILVINAQTLAGYTPLTIINDYATDDPAPDVEGTMDAVIETPTAFTVVSGDGSAHLDSYGSFISGQLGFTATKACNGTTDVLDGTLTGKIAVKDPVFGTLKFNGPTALGAALGNGDANFKSC